MSLNAYEQRTLRRIADELAVSDPKLASILGVLNRLASGEAMPARPPPISGSVGRIRAWSAWARGWRHDWACVGGASGGSGAANAFSSTQTNVWYPHSGRREEE